MGGIDIFKQMEELMDDSLVGPSQQYKEKIKDLRNVCYYNWVGPQYYLA